MIFKLTIEVLSWLTGRAFWFDVAARGAEKRGENELAAEFRRAAAFDRYRRMKKV